MMQIENIKQLAVFFSRLKYCSENYNYTTLPVTRKLLNIPSNRTYNYIKQSAKYNFVMEKKDFPKVNQDELLDFKQKTLLKNHIMSQY